MPTTLNELIAAASEKLECLPEAGTLAISGITADSRNVQKGNLFFAMKGQMSDGTAFIPQARAAGAVAVVTDKGAEIDGKGLVVIRSSEPRLALAQMAAKFFEAQPAHVAAVTGTDGKTSTADFFRQFWHFMGFQSASVGTLGILSGAGDNLYPGSLTTPYPVQLHRTLAELSAKGYQHVCMEASSHGLHQYRLHGVALEAAAFTNIARDHLDYHKTEEEYFAAKTKLFTELLPAGRTAVLNQDDAKFLQLKAICEKKGHQIIGFGRRGEQFRILKIEPLTHGQRAEVELFGRARVLNIPVVGGFQVMNILTALGLTVGIGGDMEKALSVISEFHGVPGRLEQVAQLANGATVFIDYAHTPMALANILKTLRPHAMGRLRVVFGCGGNRDAGKRPEMGKYAHELADDVIVTDDNPRSEDPALIRKAILAAAPGAHEIADREQAIHTALKSLEGGDVLVIAGKGHEKYQLVGDKTLPFDDAEVAKQGAARLKLAS